MKIIISILGLIFLSKIQGQITGGGNSWSPPSYEACEGRVELVKILKGPETETKPLEIFVKGEKKGKIKGAKRGHKYMVMASGNCCWKFYKGKRYNKSYQKIRASARFKKLNFIPRSYKAKNC